MKILAIIVSALVLSGCMTANMLEAERSYYQAAVKLQAAKAAQPLFELTPANHAITPFRGNHGLSGGECQAFPSKNSNTARASAPLSSVNKSIRYVSHT